MRLDERAMEGDHGAVTVLVSRHVRPRRSPAFIAITQEMLLPREAFAAIEVGNSRYR